MLGLSHQWIIWIIWWLGVQDNGRILRFVSILKKQAVLSLSEANLSVVFNADMITLFIIGSLIEKNCSRAVFRVGGTQNAHRHIEGRHVATENRMTWWRTVVQWSGSKEKSHQYDLPRKKSEGHKGWNLHHIYQKHSLRGRMAVGL